MIIIADYIGQTCNRFWSFLPSLIECIDKNEKMYVLVPDIEIKYYPYLLKSKYIHFPLYKNFFIKLLGFKWYKKIIIKLMRYIHLNSILTFFSQRNKNIKFINAWDSIINFKGEVSFEHKKELQKIFMPSEQITQEIQSIIKTVREKYKIIIGLHVRRGDYARWNNGAYYFSFEQYEIICKQLEEIFNKNVFFFIATNEYSQSFLTNENKYSLNKTAIHDLYLLSQCDYIIGPPSSFSRWAAFIGEKPIYQIYNPNEKIQIKNFSQIKDLSHILPFT